MPTANALRLEIELALENRFPSALTPRPKGLCEVAPTGMQRVDAMLEGGLPVGAISEVTGPESSGRTSLALSFLAQLTREDRVCAWVDSKDALDPESAAASGVSLRQLLWVRCQDGRKRTGNKPWEKGKPWERLDQAVRATDLLLQAGGFAAIVLDLGDTLPEHANRIPLSTWFRFRQAAHRSRACLVVLGQATYAQSSAAVVLECTPMRGVTAGNTVLERFAFDIQRKRQRFSPVRSVTPKPTPVKKPPLSTWNANGVVGLPDSRWDRERLA